MPTVLKPWMPTETYASYVAEEIRCIAHLGYEWRPDAWEILTERMSVEYMSGSTGGPAATLIYSLLVEVAVEYLGNHPDPNKFRYLYRQIDTFAQKLDQYVKILQRHYTIDEVCMLKKAVQNLQMHSNRIRTFQPDTS